MDYDQDYTKLNATEQHWYDYPREGAGIDDGASLSDVSSPARCHGDVSPDMLDNEDFD